MPTPESKNDEPCQLLHNTIHRCLEAKAIPVPKWGELRTGRRRDQMRALQAGSDKLVVYVKNAWPKARLRERVRLYNLFVDTLVHWMEDTNKPLRYGNVARYLPQIPVLMAQAFPGYAECGALAMLLRLHEQVRHVAQATGTSAAPRDFSES